MNIFMVIWCMGWATYELRLLCNSKHNGNIGYILYHMFAFIIQVFCGSFFLFLIFGKDN